MNIENNQDTSKTPASPQSPKRKRTVKMPRFLSFEEQQELEQAINALARRYTITKLKIETPRYKMLFEMPSRKQFDPTSDPTQVLALKSYRPKMKIQGVPYAPKVGPGTPFETPEEAFLELTKRVKKRFKNNRAKWSEEKKAKVRAYHQAWCQQNQDRLTEYNLRRQKDIRG